MLSVNFMFDVMGHIMHHSETLKQCSCFIFIPVQFFGEGLDILIRISHSNTTE